MNEDFQDLLDLVERSSNVNDPDDQVTCRSCGSLTTEYALMWAKPMCGSCANEFYYDQVSEGVTK